MFFLMIQFRAFGGGGKCTNVYFELIEVKRTGWHLCHDMSNVHNNISMETKHD